MSYIIPPRLRKSDYAKGAITQDEYLRVAASNDANIAAARKAVKMGEVVQLTPVQTSTPDEILADIAKQESDARSNLLRLGFRDQEAARITADLMNEQDVLRTLNINFPAIEADVMKRFNPKLITPAFFLQYLREYNETLNAARGLDVNSSASIRRPINAFINNIAELRTIMPDPEVIDYIRNVAENQQIISRATIERLDALRDILLGQQQLTALGQQPPAVQYELIQEITDLLRDIPTRAEVDNIARFLGDEMRSGSNIQRREIIDLINGLAASVPNRRELEEISRAYTDAGISTAPAPAPSVAEATIEEASIGRRLTKREQEAVDNYNKAKGREAMERTSDDLVKVFGSNDAMRIMGALAQKRRQEAIGDVSTLTGETDTSETTLLSARSISSATLKQIKATFKANPEFINDLRATANVGKYRAGDKVNYNDLQKSIPEEKPTQRKIYIQDTNIDAIFTAKFGKGIKTGHLSDRIKRGEVYNKVAKKVMNTIGGNVVIAEYKEAKSQVKPPPLRKIKLGKGISVQEQPTYREFGKYAIHMPQLEQEDTLNVKYKSLGGVPKFKPFPVSDIFRDFMLDVLDGKRPSERVYLQIEPKERKAFEDIAIGAGVWNGLGLKRTTTNQDEEERKRFEVLKGIYMAGNNSTQVSQELRRLVTKFINDGKMKRQQGLNLLMELSI